MGTDAQRIRAWPYPPGEDSDHGEFAWRGVSAVLPVIYQATEARELIGKRGGTFLRLFSSLYGKVQDRPLDKPLKLPGQLQAFVEKSGLPTARSKLV